MSTALGSRPPATVYVVPAARHPVPFLAGRFDYATCATPSREPAGNTIVVGGWLQGEEGRMPSCHVQCVSAAPSGGIGGRETGWYCGASGGQEGRKRRGERLRMPPCHLLRRSCPEKRWEAAVSGGGKRGRIAEHRAGERDGNDERRRGTVPLCHLRHAPGAGERPEAAGSWGIGGSGVVLRRTGQARASETTGGDGCQEVLEGGGKRRDGGWVQICTSRWRERKWAKAGVNGLK
ncbi:hypothetical protein B0H19DRAFT_1084147 [Mycena capillaripes]|nr:hypothetical protein B0H19DRAFT_1084147 [Mycena capillaripes]